MGMVALSTIGRQFRRSRSGSETASSWHQKGRDLEAHAGSKIKTSRETNTWLYQMLPWAPCNKPAQTTHHPRIPACRFLSGCQSASDQLSKRLTLPSPGISYFLGSMKQAGKNITNGSGGPFIFHNSVLKYANKSPFVGLKYAENRIDICWAFPGAEF